MDIVVRYAFLVGIDRMDISVNPPPRLDTDVEIIAVDGNKKRLQAFIALALDMDKCFSQQLPRFHTSEKALFDPGKNFFLQQSHSRYWLAKRGKQYIGRIAAIVDRDLSSNHTRLNTGLIGLYEAKEDSALAYRLINTAVQYLQNKGCASIIGPVDFSIYHRYRYQSDCFDSQGFIGEPRNPKYYLDHFKENGFICKYTWESHWLSSDAMEKSMAELTVDYQQSLELGYQFVSFKHYHQDKAIELLWCLIQKTYRGMPGFLPVSFQYFKQQFSALWKITDIDTSLFLLDDNDEPVGFSVVFQDKMAAIRSMNGRTHLWAKLKFKLNEHKGEVANAYQTGILYSAIKRAAMRGLKKNNRRLSMTKAIYYHCALQIKNNPQYKAAIIALLRSDTPNIHITKKFATQTRHYQLLTRHVKPLTTDQSPTNITSTQ